jgi:hypothetical protein
LHQRAPGDCNNALRQSSGAAFQNDWLGWMKAAGAFMACRANYAISRTLAVLRANLDYG